MRQVWILLIVFGIKMIKIIGALFLLFTFPKLRAKLLQLCLTLCDPMGLALKFLCPWDYPGKNSEVGSHFLLQGIIFSALHRDQPASPVLTGKCFTTEPPGKSNLWIDIQYKIFQPKIIFWRLYFQPFYCSGSNIQLMTIMFFVVWMIF